MSGRVEAALEYQARGWRVIQLHGVAKNGGCTCKKNLECRSTGKHPVVDEWQKLPPMDADEIRATWSGWRANHNVGLATGHDFWVLDIDPDNGGLESARRLAEEQGAEFDPTRVVKTGSGGFHYFFQVPDDFEIGQSRGELKAYPGIDVRGKGGQVVAPPSVTDKGDYRVVADDPIGPAPAWLLDMLRPKERETPSPAPSSEGRRQEGDPRLEAYAEKAWNGEVARLTAMAEAAVPEGQTYVGEPWDQTTFEVACNLLEIANAEWSPYTHADAQIEVDEKAPTDSGFTREDVRKKIDSAVTKVGDRARSAPPERTGIFGDPIDVSSWNIPSWTENTRVDEPKVERALRDWPMRSWDDVGNADRMVDHYGDRLRYIPTIRTWAIYDGGRWAQVDTAEVQELTIRMINALPHGEALLYDETPGDDDEPSMRDRFLGFVKKQRMASRIAACLTLTTSHPRIRARLEDFDADPRLLCVANGVVDLQTGRLTEHDPDLMLMKASPAVYDPDAECKGWQAFLDRVMPDPEMQGYLQRIVGYSLTGLMDERAFFIHHGNGANGKSVFLQVIRAVVGEYGQSVPRDTLLAKKTSEHPTSVARMAGKRFLEVSETGPGKRLDEEMVKGLTGGEQQTARMMGKDFFDFTPTGKIHYVTNFLPRLSDAPSIWSRLHLIKWGVTIPPREQEFGLADRIVREELSGVLAWAVRGAVVWHSRRLSPPAVAREEIEHYREDVDTFGDFLREHTAPADADTLTKTGDLYFAYKGWAFGQGTSKPYSQQSFNAIMKERGHEYVRRGNGRYFKGIVVVSHQEASIWS